MSCSNDSCLSNSDKDYQVVNTKRHKRAVTQRLMLEQSGVTLLEMLFGIGLFLILSTIAVPNLGIWESSFHRNNARNELEFAVRRAKTEALAEGARCIMALKPDGVGFDIGIDTMPYNDPPLSDSDEFHSTFPMGIAMAFSDTLMFDSRGYLVDANDVTTNITVTLSQHGSAFSTATIYATGYIEW